jgi:hypothetical protein
MVAAEYALVHVWSWIRQLDMEKELWLMMSCFNGQDYPHNTKLAPFQFDT